MATSRPNYSVAALEKGLRVLTLFSRERKALRTTDIAELASLPVPTAYRIIMTLVETGYLEQLDDGRLRPSLNVLRLGYASIAGSDLIEASNVPVAKLAEVTKATVNVAVLAPPSVLFVRRIPSNDLVTANISVGTLLPAICTSTGKVLLGKLSDDEITDIVARTDLEQCSGSRAKTDPAVVIEDVRRAAGQGFAVQQDELADGLRSVATPVYDAGGRVVAALNVARRHHPDGPGLEEFLDSVLPHLLLAASSIAEALGAPPEHLATLPSA